MGRERIFAKPLDTVTESWLDTYMTTTRTNANKSYLVTVSNGDTFVETCRNTLGGHANALGRIAARYGSHRFDVRLTSGTSGTVAGMSFTLLEVQK